MRFAWSLILCLWVSFTAFAKEEESEPPSKPSILDIFHKPRMQIPGLDLFTKPKIQVPGLDFFTKPKTPQSGFQVHKQIVTPFGGTSFGFGFGTGGHFGSSSPGDGVNLPPAEKHEPGKHGVNWEEGKENIGPRPNWGDDDEKQPKPESYDDKGKPKPETYEEEKKDSRPDWEEIGEKENRSEDMMEGDLVGDGLIQPRNRDRVKRFIESKIYHVALKKGFISNARVSRVKFRRHDNMPDSGM